MELREVQNLEKEKKYVLFDETAYIEEDEESYEYNKITVNKYNIKKPFCFEYISNTTGIGYIDDREICRPSEFKYFREVVESAEEFEYVLTFPYSEHTDVDTEKCKVLYKHENGQYLLESINGTLFLADKVYPLTAPYEVKVLNSVVEDIKSLTIDNSQITSESLYNIKDVVMSCIKVIRSLEEKDD
jgi:hypothetical protein